MSTLMYEWDMKQRQDQLSRELRQRDSWHLEGGRLPQARFFSWLKPRVTMPIGDAVPTVRETKAKSSTSKRAG